jgi:transcriptional regulator with GAF, ATPase, and Fis domain
MAEQIKWIYQISNIANSVENLQDLADKVTKILCEVLDVDMGILLVFDPREKRFSSKAVNTKKDKGRSFAFSTELVEKVLREGSAILSEEADLRIVIAPLRGRKENLGAIYLAGRAKASGIGEEILYFLNSIGSILGIAMENIALRERLSNENITLRKTLLEGYKIVGKSAKMERLLELVDKSASSDATVILTGETGTGKELLARAIHYKSRRGGKPFVVINCGAIPEGLLESELFGHEKGAFTGALSQRIGRFEEADGGTIFLDEISELTPSAQVKLLRVLEYKIIQRLGSAKDIKIDTRIIAATNKNLRDLVKEGRFREDLYYRISIINIELPPLREHKEDIPELASYFLGLFNRGKRLSKDAMQKLINYNWPGNIRELRNVIERAVIFAGAQEITPEQIIFTEPSWSPPISLREIERAHIIKVLKMTGGNKSRAAEILGLDRSSLYVKLKNLSIEEDIVE